MNRTLTFLRLDFVTVKPYFGLKNLLPFLFMAVFFGFTTGGRGLVTAFLAIMWAVVFSSYPFAAGEQSGIDALYCTLCVSRRHVVSGRYLYALCMDVLGALAALALMLLSRALGPVTGDLLAPDHLALGSYFASVGAAMFAVSIIQAFQLPIYFKLGYTKSKLLAMLPLFLFSFVIAAGALLSEDGFASTINAASAFLSANALSAALIGLGAWICVVFVSYQLSLRFYRKREF